MRSNKDLWLRGAAAFAWIVVLACAAYASVNFTRKDWRDFTPVEKIGFFTPDRVQWGPPVALMHPRSEIVTVDVSGPMGSFLLVWPSLRPDQRPSLARVGSESLQLEVERGSVLEAAIDACLERGLRAGASDARARLGIKELRERLGLPNGETAS